MKKRKFLCLVFSTVFALGAITGCNRGGGESKDVTKTQLYVSNYDGGVGTDWLRDIKERFEEEYKDTSFEQGKTGVQILIDPNKTEGGDFSFDKTICEVAFTEKVPATFFTTERLMDLTDVYNYIIGQQGITLDKNIEDSLKIFDGKIYAIPHYEGGGGIIYDKDLFDKKSFYLDKDGNYCDAEGDLSNGPDGQPNTSDDGLPATIEELMNLCKRIQQRSCVPFILSGENRTSYNTFLLDRIASSYEGKQATEANFTYSLNNARYITSISDDDDEIFGYKFTTSTANVTEENGYLLKQQVGKFYGLAVLNEMIQKQYYDTRGWASTVSHLDAQEMYIKSTTTQSPIAMLIDGTWWENEATDAFKRMSATNNKYAKDQRNFGWMPIPTKVNSEDTNVNGDSMLTLNHLAAYGFAKAGLSSEKQELVKTFLKYVYSTENMIKFTEQTGTTRPFSYQLPESSINKLTAFQKDVYNLHVNSSYVYVHSGNEFFTANEKKLFTDRWRGTTDANSVVSFFSDNPVSVKNYYQQLWVSSEDWNAQYESYFKKK